MKSRVGQSRFSPRAASGAHSASDTGVGALTRPGLSAFRILRHDQRDDGVVCRLGALCRRRRKRQRFGPSGSIESDPAVNVRARRVRPRAGSLPIELGIRFREGALLKLRPAAYIEYYEQSRIIVLAL